ncbi:MAG TPA: substrate-binding domain-containing protein [Gammaproteobacteria bacterium]
MHRSHPLRSALSLLFATLLAAGWHGAGQAATAELRWVGCGISKLGFMEELAKAYERKNGVRIVLEGGGATKGLRQVASLHADMGGSCRLPLVYKNSDGSFQIEESERKVKIIPVGWDVLVAITNRDNPLIDSITRQQLRDVLTGKITRWSELGAASDKPINLYVREGKISGVGQTLRQQLFDDPNQEFTPRAIRLASSGKIEKAIAADPYGLAVSGISSSRHQPVKMLKLDRIEPSMETLAAGDYQLYRLLFLVVSESYSERPEIADFVRFALSVEGQQVIRDAGTLPYHQGVRLIFSSTSHDYLNTIDILEQYKIYTLSGQ